MSKSQLFPIRSRNHLLTRLTADSYQNLARHFQKVKLPVKQVLYEARARIDYAYFPESGIISAMTTLTDGRSIEVATVGNEGLMGLTAFVGAASSPNEVMVQVEGDGVRIRADLLKAEVQRDERVREVLLLYHSAYLVQVSYAVACNGLHAIQQRCSRWLLMTHDRVGADELPLTHEFLAIMLGVRRASVTEVLQPLQEEGLIRNQRGLIIILDRRGLEAKACECYQNVRNEYQRLLG